ncbi:MAG: hypothetical protein MUO76_22095, partial [Anaerolineaceae bacterium]|nr:hypothetical protein [Anaerolineaceae bacterium]
MQTKNISFSAILLYMIIHPIELYKSDSEVRVSAQIEFKKSIERIPNSLWFRFPIAQAENISSDHDGWLVSLLLVGMHLGEDIEIRGNISPKLFYNLDLIQSIYHAYYPKLFKRKATITPQSLIVPRSNPGIVATVYSGGVDSSYTIKRLLAQPARDPQDQLSHGIFINGFEHFQADQHIYDNLASVYQDVLGALNLKLILAASNFYDFYRNRINWLYVHEAPLVGTVLVLGKGMKCFYKPADLDSPTGKITKPSFALHLFSTEKTEIVIHEPHIDRGERLDYIKDWPAAVNHLRMCSSPQKKLDSSACYRCAKCLRICLLLE